MEEREYPKWVCRDCGEAHGRSSVHIATFHDDTCGVCGEFKSCTEPRDFGHLYDSWKDHPQRVSYPVPTEEEIFAKLQLEMPDPMDGISRRKQWLSMIQIMNDDLSRRNGFTVDYASVFRMVPEVGELVDAVLKYEGMKKIKSTDSLENQFEEIRDGIGDVLVLLAQVASHYKIDMQEAYTDTYHLLTKRSYHE